MLKVLSLFSGIGAFEKALTNLEVDFDLIGYCEIDKYASKSYAAVHGVSEEMNLWDVTKIDTFKLPKDIDLVTYGFPCQDISVAGKQKGFQHEDGSLTRSGLFFEALRIIEDTKPKVAIAENVKNLTSKKFSEQFKTVLQSLEEAGYNNYWKVLNAKDHGIPQNRERVFIVSIRKDIDNGLFEFPKSFPLEKRLKDMLEDEVDEKFYLSDKTIRSYEEHKARSKAKGNGFGWEPTVGEGIATTLQTDSCSQASSNFIIKQVGQLYPNSGNPQAGRIYDAEGIAPAMDTCQGGNRMPKIVDDFYKNREPREYTEVAPALRADRQGLKVYGRENMRVRKLTPKESWRLMGFSDEDFEKAEKVNSNTQLYKQAGNSIVVDVLEELFCMMLDEDGKFFCLNCHFK